MKVDFTIKEKLVGVFVITGAFILLSTIVVIGRGKDWFENYATFYSTFQESYNLQTNAAVKLYNTQIGKVNQITLVEDKVRVKLLILEQYISRIRTDTIATVESPTFIGSEYVSITPGNPDSPLIPEGGEIKSMERKSISDYMEEFEVEKTAKMFIGAVQNLSEITETLKDPEGPLFSALHTINRTLNRFDEIVMNVQNGKGFLGDLLKSEDIILTLRTELEQIRIILTHLEKATEQSPELMTRAVDGLTTIQDVSTELSKSAPMIRQILKQIDESMVNLATVIDNLKKGSYDVPKITQSTEKGIEEIRDGVENVDKVVRSLQKNILIRQNIPPEPVVDDMDAGLRE